MARPASVFDVGRIDQSLARGLLKRMLREGSASCRSILEKENSLRASGAIGGKRSRAVIYRRNKDIARRALGNFIVEELPLDKPRRCGQRGKPYATMFVGLDTSMGRDLRGNEAALSAVLVNVNYKACTFDARFLPVSVSYHTIERIIERHQIRDMAELRPYLAEAVWSGYVAAEVADPGNNWAFTQRGAMSMDVSPDKAVTVLTWVPRELWSMSQRALFEKYGGGNGLVLTTSSFHSVAIPHRAFRPRMKNWVRSDLHPVVIRV